MKSKQNMTMVISMIEWEYIAVPSDEPPPMSMVRQAQKYADNHDETVVIKDTQGRVHDVYHSEFQCLE